jgi:TolB-like protein/DNA-binding SARP family transcriptional activator
MAQIRLTLLGGFAACRSDGAAVALPTRKAEALLAVLACRPGEALRRECLTALLWGERGDQQARHSLSQTLTTIRHVLNGAGPLLVAERETVALAPGAAEVDVVEFQRLAAGDAAADLGAAVELYRGPLLDGLKLSEPGLEEWLSQERTRLHGLAVAAAVNLAERQIALGAAEAAAAALVRALTLDPLAEEVHRRLIRLHLDLGAYNAAIRRYRQCAEILKRELDTIPEPATSALHQEALSALARADERDPQGGAIHSPDADGAWTETALNAEQAVLAPDASVGAAPDAGRRVAIAVLPFINISGDPEQQYFADGLTEDIITDLSRFRLLQVASRNASFRYRRPGGDARRIGRELGVDYLVLGSLRRHGTRMRLTAQLVDARCDNQVWAERFDREQDDVFAVADEFVRTIAGTLAGRVNAAGCELAKRKPPASLAAYECVLRADAAEMQVGDPQAEDEMRRFYEQAVELDPDYGRARAGLAIAYLRTWFRDMSGSDAALDSAFALAKRAVVLDPNDSECQETLGWILLHCQSFELANQYYRRSLELNPISPETLASMGALCSFEGRPEDGIAWFERTKGVDPFFDPTWYWQLLGATYFNARRYDEAIRSFERSVGKPVWVHAYLAACHAQAGRSEEAAVLAAAVTRLCPDFSADLLAAKEPFALATDREHLLDGLHKAGLAAPARPLSSRRAARSCRDPAPGGSAGGTGWS